MTKVTKAVAEAVTGLQELLVKIGKTQRRMGRILRARSQAKGRSMEDDHAVICG